MRPTRRDEVVAGAWAFAEATLFFVIPDVWLTWVAIQAKAAAKPLFWMVWYATFAAVLGGLAIETLGTYAPKAAERAVLAVPSVSADDLTTVRGEYAEVGSRAVATGWLRGQPYKLYALVEGEQPGSARPFMYWSILARGGRFLLTTIVAFGLATLVGRPRAMRFVWATAWACVYAAYWWMNPLWS